MAYVRVVYWREIPSLVEAFENGETVRIPLSSRFQELIDLVAMKESASESHDYLDGWRQGPLVSRAGSPREAGAEVASEIEASFPILRQKFLPSAT